MMTKKTTKSITESENEKLKRNASLMYQMLKRIADEKEPWAVPMVKKVLRICKESNSF